MRPSAEARPSSHVWHALTDDRKEGRGERLGEMSSRSDVADDRDDIIERRTPHPSLLASIRACHTAFALVVTTLLIGCDFLYQKQPDDRSADPVAQQAASSVTGSIQFVDRTSENGIEFQYRDGQEAGYWTMLEALGGGVAACDYDRDGLVDLFPVGGGRFGPNSEIYGLPVGAFRHQANGRFTSVGSEAGLTVPSFYTHGAAAGDYDNDGFPDLLITGYHGLLLYRNMGEGTFLESAADSGLLGTSWGGSAAWGDLNGDGWLDLYLVHYVNWSWDNHPLCPGSVHDQRDLCAPKDFEPLADTLYVSDGDGTFRDASEEAGLRLDGKGLGVLMADLDLDGHLDIYVGNDGTPNFLYKNSGMFPLEEVGLPSATSVNDRGDPDGSMGLDVFDFNLDGRPDLWVANYEDESFAVYRNQGNGLFRHVSRVTGIMAVGGLYVGWGTVASDLDRDGDEDLFVTNGHVIRFPTRAPVSQLPLLFENLRGEKFINVASKAGECLTSPHLGRGLAAADLDDDGDHDLILTPINEPLQILENVTSTPNHWLGLQLIGTVGNRDAIGAIATLETSHGSQIRQVKGGGSFASSSDPRLLFGCGDAKETIRLTIRWPGGQTQVVEAPQLDRYHTLREPRSPAPGTVP